MMRTISAILIAALSSVLAGPPAFARDGNSSASDEDSGAPRLRLDAGTVVRAGDGDAAILFDFDGSLEFERFTRTGRRYGLVVGGRLERDKGRRGWGGLAGDCPAGSADCATASDASGADRPLLAPVSGFRSAGPADGERTRGAIDAAYVFYDTGWGELRAGYGPGAARLDAVSGPAAFRLTRADGGRVNTGLLSGARTANPSSGQDPKLVFRSVALGQESSVGTLRLSASYTPAVRNCGVDICAREYGPAGLLSPVSDDVAELGLHYAVRRGGHEWEFGLGTARGGDATGRPGFIGIETHDAGLAWSHGAWSAGVRGLVSNNGLAGDRGYTAWSASGGYETGSWLFTLEYAGFSDDAVHVDGAGWQAGGSRLIGERWLLGGGVQAMRRREPILTPSGRRQRELDALTAFVELGWQF